MISLYRMGQAAIGTDEFTSQTVMVSLRRFRFPACKFRFLAEYSESMLIDDYLLSRLAYRSAFEESRGILMKRARVRIIIESRRSVFRADRRLQKATSIGAKRR
jgi:hypothetical protein